MGEIGTNINDLLDQKKVLSNEENSIVDSIVNDLNSKGGLQTSQEKLPQITDEEKQMLMRQRNNEEQKKRQQQMQYQQRMMQQQQMQQEIHRQQVQQQKEMMDFMEKNKDIDIFSKIKGYTLNSLDVISIFILTIIFNTDNFSNFLKFKSVPFFYNIELEKSKFSGIVLKSFILAISFAIIKYFIK